MSTQVKKWNERYAGKELIWSAGPNLLLKELAENLRPGRALDVACGEGRNAIWLAERGWQVDAIDFSSVGIEKARRIAAHRGVSVNFVVADALGLKPEGTALEPVSYDLVVVAFLHTSPEERNIWIPALANLVQPGGRFLYIAHDPENIEHGTGGPQDPALLPTADEVASYLAGWQLIEAGTRIRSTTVESGHGEQGSEGQKAIDTLVLAARPEQVD